MRNAILGGILLASTGCAAEQTQANTAPVHQEQKPFFHSDGTDGTYATRLLSPIRRMEKIVGRNDGCQIIYDDCLRRNNSSFPLDTCTALKYDCHLAIVEAVNQIRQACYNGFEAPLCPPQQPEKSDSEAKEQCYWYNATIAHKVITDVLKTIGSNIKEVDRDTSKQKTCDELHQECLERSPCSQLVDAEKVCGEHRKDCRIITKKRVRKEK